MQPVTDELQDHSSFMAMEEKTSFLQSTLFLSNLSGEERRALATALLLHNAVQLRACTPALERASEISCQQFNPDHNEFTVLTLGKRGKDRKKET